MSLADHLDKLKAFKIIAESSTMGEAAKQLNVTQPSLTRLIQTLEHESQSQLLYRGRSGVAPTESGKILLAYAVKTLKGLEDISIRIKNPSNDHSGHLRIGSYESLTEYLWPEFIASFKKKEPALKISISTSQSNQHIQALAKGVIDILIDAEPRTQGDFISWKIFDDKFNFYSSEPSIEIGPESLNDYPLIYCPAAFDHNNKYIIQYLEESQYDFKEKIELDSFPSVKTFCMHGLGIAVLPERLAYRSVKSKEIHKVSLAGFSKGFGAHSIIATIQHHKKDDPRIRTLIKYLRDWYKPLPRAEKI